MANISSELQAILDARYGEEVRGSIHDAIAAMNEEAEHAEAWATGGSGGTASATNNAKYYSEVASAAAMTYYAPPASGTFSIGDMGMNKFTRCLASKFSDCPEDVDSSDYIYIEKTRANEDGSVSAITLRSTLANREYCYYGTYTTTFQGWKRVATEKDVISFFYTADMEYFSVSDMPRNSFTMAKADIFTDCPAELLTAREYLYIERKNMNRYGNVSIVTVFDQANFENVYTALFTEGSPDTLRSWVRSNHGRDLTEGYRSSTLSRTVGGVDYAYAADKNAYHVWGERTGTTFYNITRNIPTSGGKTYYFLFEHETDNVTLEIWGHNGSNTLQSIEVGITQRLRRITIPVGIVDFYYRFLPKEGAEIDEYASVYVTEEDHLDSKILKELALTANTGALPSCDLDDLTLQSSLWLLSDSNTYENTPNNAKAGYLAIYRFGNWTLQIFYNLSAYKMWLRRANAYGSWTEWAELSGSGGGGSVINNEYIFNQYSNTLNATVSPTIKTDSNQYLEATGDTTDVKAAIEALLATGVCRLGPGDFYVSGIDMPERSMLIGSGKKTRLILLGSSSDEGYAIHMNNFCTVRDMSIMGSTTSFVYPTEYNYVNRHGILFEANYSGDSSTRKRCVVDSCEIRSFSGGGITCYDTGYPVDSTLMVSNCIVMYCMVGINIPYYSEFNIFTSCRADHNYYGSINNGGNNIFSACNFSANRVGMLMDNSQGQSPNNSHGTVVGCIFDHADSNSGVGIKVDGCRNGQIFSDCQLFYADIEVNNSAGIQFNHFNVGGNTTNSITVTKGSDGGAVIFNGFLFKVGSYEFNIEQGYTAVKVINCFDKDGEAVTA